MDSGVKGKISLSLSLFLRFLRRRRNTHNPTANATPARLPTAIPAILGAFDLVEEEDMAAAVVEAAVERTVV